MSIVVHGRGPGGGEIREDRSWDELRQILERIHEEVRTARLLVRQIELRDTLAHHVVAALRESLLTRVFRLRRFFYDEGEQDQEVVAHDFFPDAADWDAARPPPAPHLSRWLDDLSIWIAERTYFEKEARVPVQAWPLDSLVDSLTSAHEAFGEALLEHYQHPLLGHSWASEDEEDDHLT